MMRISGRKPTAGFFKAGQTEPSASETISARQKHWNRRAPLPLYSLFRIYSVFHLFLVYLRSLHAIAAVSFQVHIRLRHFSFWHGLAELFLFQCFCLAVIVSEADGSVWPALTTLGFRLRDSHHLLCTPRYVTSL